ncbi:Eco57I restriction-modification methylase domain-containing protein [Aeromonas allosaccharophila]|uniref:Eco57I restriction-modification methylase domain-containing protein n=1 Tax=Aeromonas allosaccharophila TaxID=656 RepID=UPI003005239E
MTSLHDDWLSLIDISGPFMAVPVLKEAFPQGLEELDGTKRKRLRQAYEEWRDALEQDDPQLDELHSAWIDEVLSRGLELDEDGKGDVLKRADWCAINLKAVLPDHGVALSPDQAVVDEQRANKPMMLIHTYAQDVDLDATQKLDGWAATPADRMVQLCRTLGCRLGLITNGERWMIVDAPVGAVTSFASWYARLWSQEPITLQAFVHLLSIRRFFFDESEQLPALFDSSLKYQDEVTDALGEQVRRAVEVLIQSLDKADQDRNRELLHDVKEPELYEAALTVMMRLVFLLSAEERGLLLLGDERYEANYALSTLRMQLRKESEEILERRWDAWSRLLAIFRAVYCGVEHENLRLPALGSSLFDPDHFPFLEGRAKGSNWRVDAARPLPIDNRTVLLLLEAIQQFQGRTLSYRALDVEQIGYVYEGLLERTVKRTDEVTLELDATKRSQSPWVKLAELDAASIDGAERLVELLQERSGSSVSRVHNGLSKPIDDTLADRLLTTCQGNLQLRDRIKPYANLLRTDPWGYPLVYPAGAFIVTSGSNRRETGTHYTPKSLTEAIVTETLTPVAYIGPANGTPREGWRLKSPAELLDLKICDPAMGSGAFLVQACRWLADRLNEAWSLAEANGKAISVDGDVLDLLDTQEPLPRDLDARIVIARRLIAERCLYGVDLNPLAVELAKLSIWLVTLAKGRPFGFLDHSLRCGDSLLGIHRLDQLTQLSMKPTGQGQLPLFGQNIEKAVREAIELRQKLREMPIRDIHDVEAMARLDADTRRKLEVPECIADAFIGEVFAAGLGNALASLTIQAEQAIDGDRDVLATMCQRSIAAFSTDLPADKAARRPFHWPLEFPEVFCSKNRGFTAIIGNPPFMGGTLISGRMGKSYQVFLRDKFTSELDNGGRGDFCAYFFLKAAQLLHSEGTMGLVGTKTIGEGDTKTIGLAQLHRKNFQIYSANTNIPWPGAANVSVSLVWICREWHGPFTLNGIQVPVISPSLNAQNPTEAQAKPLASNLGLACEGVRTIGMGFVIGQDEAQYLLNDDIKNVEVVKPFVDGKDINSNPAQEAGRYCICFFDWPEEKAKRYKQPWRFIEENVKPERQRLKSDGSFQLRSPMPQRYWQFGDMRMSFRRQAENLQELLIVVQTSKYVSASIQKNDRVFSQSLVMIASDDLGLFASINSSIHSSWIQSTCSNMGATQRYIVTDGFNTYPFPSSSPVLQNMGKAFNSTRRKAMLDYSCGLTEIYNNLHDPSCTLEGIVALRALQAQLDNTITHAYGWHDFDLEHGFHKVPYLPENDRLRFTISEAARVEVLRRLSELNRQRYEEEVAKGLHGSKVKGSGGRAPQVTTTAPAVQPSFDFGAQATPLPPTTAILNFLSTHTHWHSKSDVLAATSIKDGQWNTSIAELISSGKVERQGERRGTRYRAKK